MRERLKLIIKLSRQGTSIETTLFNDLAGSQNPCNFTPTAAVHTEVAKVRMCRMSRDDWPSPFELPYIFLALNTL